MPTRITPFPKPGDSGAKEGKGGQLAQKPNTQGVQKRQFLNNAATRITTARRHFSTVVAARGQGYTHAIIFTTCVALGLIILGIVLVYIGDDNYIIDVMVLGGLCLVMGVGALILSCAFTLRPLYKERQRKKRERERIRLEQLPPPSAQDDYFTPALVTEELIVPGPAPDIRLYDRESLGARHDDRGRLEAPSPPPLAQPIAQPPSPPPLALPNSGRGESMCTVLTTVGPDSNEVSELNTTKGLASMILADQPS